MKIEIKNRWTLGVIFECEADSMRVAVELAVSKCAYLSDADLSDADLRGAYLRGAYLRGAKYGDYPITITPLQIIGLYWDVLILDTAIKIGCQIHRIDELDAFDDSTIKSMASNALPFWDEHKTLIITAARLHSAKAAKANETEAAA